MKQLSIVGAGSWGTALAIVLSPRFERVRLWVREPALGSRMAESGENDVYLPGFFLPSNVEAVSDLAVALSGAHFVIGAIPSRYARTVYVQMRPYLQREMIFVSATKGLERNSLLRMSQVMTDVFGAAFSPNVGVLSGPTFAREIARGCPSAVVIASENRDLAADVQRAFSGPSFRLYSSDDPIGVEIGAALKNVIAIGAGICSGLGLGSNATAALVTRGLAEITRLAVAMGGQPNTLAGLAGLGDLVLTCTGPQSRNRTVGVELAKGRQLDEILAGMTMVAEGVETVSAAVELASKLHVDMPITSEMASILAGTRSPKEAIRELMERSLKHE